MVRRRSPYDIPPVDLPKYKKPSSYWDDAPPIDLPKYKKPSSYWDDENDNNLSIEESQSAIDANREIGAFAHEQRMIIQEQRRREEHERYIRSPEGIRQRQKEYDRSTHIKQKIITFFWSRPSVLIQKWLKFNSEPVNYKNYISFTVWIIWIIMPLIYGLILFPGLILVSISLMCIFYFLQFEIKYLIKQ